MKAPIFLTLILVAACLSPVKDQHIEPVPEQRNHLRAMDHKSRHHQEPITIALAVGVAAALFGMPSDPNSAMLATIIKQGAQVLKINPAEWDLASWTTRSIQLTFNNLSNQTIQVEDEYFDVGEWKKHWEFPIEPLTLTQGTVGNIGRFGGVEGSIKLRLADEDIYLYLGFANPFVKMFTLWADTKFFAEISQEDESVEYGYDKCEENKPIRNKLGKYTFSVQQFESSYAKSDFFFKFEQKGITKKTAAKILTGEL